VARRSAEPERFTGTIRRGASSRRANLDISRSGEASISQPAASRLHEIRSRATLTWPPARCRPRCPTTHGLKVYPTTIAWDAAQYQTHGSTPLRASARCGLTEAVRVHTRRHLLRTFRVTFVGISVLGAGTAAMERQTVRAVLTSGWRRLTADSTHPDHPATWAETPPPNEVLMSINPTPGRAISPLIYGVSVASAEQLAATGARLSRWGGNPNTLQLGTRERLERRPRLGVSQLWWRAGYPKQCERCR
jgi:hypothetical protein